LKIHLLSDLHLEFSDRHPPFSPCADDCDVVVLAGDIACGIAAFDWAETVFAGRHVIYVPGNHEYYDLEIGTTRQAMRKRAASSGNVRLLDNDEWIFEGVRFLGATLWTDFELFGRSRMPQAYADSLAHVTDFRKIRYGVGSLQPEHTVELHREAVNFLEHALSCPFEGPTVIVTHHAPHPGSLHPRWAQHLSSAAFVSNLERLMGRVALWLHGHTHDSFDYRVTGTRVVANPMGYRTSNWREARDGSVPSWVRYENSGFDPQLLLEV
jgi:predicted phosphodiesterase